jgi:glycosyltransferase involved in cell wall biosynthesis
MIYLFVHQNFPAQYRHLIRHLADQPDNQIYFITQPNENYMQGVVKVVYEPTKPQALNCHPFAVDFDLAVRNGVGVVQACRELLARGIRPDIVIGHNGWGEMTFVKDVFPDTPVLLYFEFYYHARNVDVGFDPEFPSGPLDAFRLRAKNAIHMLSIDVADWGNAPTRWQRSVHPPEVRPRISVIHEGIDTTAVAPDPSAWMSLKRGNVTFSRADEVITYVSRNLEPYRGFHVFMRAAREIQRRRPRARIVVVGGDDVSYGAEAPEGTTYRQIALREAGSDLDMSRIHFLGQIPYDSYLKLLQISSAHVYLTYPFVLSWSFVEAMSAGCAIIGSDTPPVMEVLEDGVNGLAVDFFSPRAIADRVDQILDHPTRMQHMRDAARATAIDKFDLKTRTLPKWLKLMDDLVHHRRPDLYLED